MWGVVESQNNSQGGNGPSPERCVRMVVANNGQTDFEVPPPIDVQSSKFFINGGKQMLGIDYTLDTLGRFKWISTKLQLKTTHLLELYYR